MKKLVLILVAFISIQSFAAGKIIKGNGIYKSETREVGSFTGLSSGGPMNVEIAYGSDDKLTIEGDENILPYIETIVTDNVLRIKVKDLNFINPKLTLRVHISMTKINSLSQSGSGTVSGSGDFSNDGNTHFNISGSGHVQLDFAKFNAADINMSGSGSLQLRGNVINDITVKQSGSGNIDCEYVNCKDASAQLSGSGNMRLNVSQSLSAHISGSGNVYYKGSPEKFDSHISGSGRIQKI